MEQYDIYLRSPERRGRRKLKRTAGVVKPEAVSSESLEPKPPGSPHASKPHSSPHTLEEIANYLNAPNKLTRKSLNRSAPKGWYQPDPSPPMMAPADTFRTSWFVQEPYTSHSESRGELQRQFAISQRLKRKQQVGSPNPTEVGAYLGGLERIHDGDGWVDGFRLEVEKPLQRVYAQRMQRGGRGSIVTPEKPRKVRFASVVECAEF
ncbi:hypothetical protein BJ322DRAFT_1063722 [Thelephora terrestris]|uniref:Uncharacterized protein n=1 Tax=Thelephora terrestris TaxID=56493 RepID=A0A9P6HEK9_9AGAM|nr:hypothetical protein BJ322DRAFT_1063722 [Thelephora terrestris]